MLFLFLFPTSGRDASAIPPDRSAMSPGPVPGALRRPERVDDGAVVDTRQAPRRDPDQPLGPALFSFVAIPETITPVRRAATTPNRESTATKVWKLVT